jgi:hypothetical protein
MTQSYADRHSAARVLDPVTMRPTGETRPTRGRDAGSLIVAPRCDECKIAFSGPMIDDKYCSAECQVKGLLRMKTCEECGKEYRRRTRDQKYCGTVCREKVQGRKQYVMRNASKVAKA